MVAGSGREAAWPTGLDEQAVVERAELLLGWSRITLPVHAPFSRTLTERVISRRELGEVLDLATRLGIVSDRLDSVRRALPKLDRERAAALKTLGSARVRQALLDELEFKVSDLQQRLNEMAAYLETHRPQQHEDFLMDDLVDNHVTLMRRTQIKRLLAELGEAAETRAARTSLASADALLRSRGAELYAPYICSGLMERIRTTVPEPPEHWWYYLDQVGPEVAGGGGEP